jgi:hypothetical protein
MKAARHKRAIHDPRLHFLAVLLGLSLLMSGACGSHTPLVNETARAQALAARAAASNSPQGTTFTIEGPSPADSNNVKSPTEQDPKTRTKEFVHHNVRNLASPNSTTVPGYPFLKAEGEKIPAVFPAHPSGEAYLTFEKGQVKITAGPNVAKPPHSGKVFDAGKRIEPTDATPYTVLPGADSKSTLSFGLGPVHGAEVQGTCTADDCTDETYYLLTYDDDMENRLKRGDVFDWDDVKGENWKAYILKPRFTEFVYSKPASLRFSSGGDALSMKLPDGTDLLNDLELTDDQPLRAQPNGTSVRIYRLLEGNTPLLVGIIKNDSSGSEVWFFAVPASSSPSGGK